MITNQSSTNQAQRPQFYENEYLGAADLTVIVEYSRLQQQRHALGAHTWGIAMGLQLKDKPSTMGSGQVDTYIQPGYAWDGFGRPIVVLAPYKIPAGLFSSIPYNGGTPGGQPVAVWLRYNEIEAQGTRPGFAVCDPADQFARVQESFQIEVGAHQNNSDKRDPVVIGGRSVDASLAFQTFDSNDPPIPDASIPYQTFPDDNPNALWLIPLGFVHWKPNSSSGQPGNFVALSNDEHKQSRMVRQYIGVVAEGIQAADGIIRMRSRTVDDSSLAWSDDLVWVEGKLRVDDDTRLFGGKLDFRDSTGQNNDIPLAIQRNSFTAPSQPGGGVPQTVTELQVVIGQSNDATNHFAVGPIQKGVSPAPDVFEEKFTVRADGKVGIGTTTPRNPLGIRGTTPDEDLISFEDTSGTTKWHINQNLGGKNPGLNFAETGIADGRLFIQAGGNVGISTTTPTNTLHVNSNTGVRQNRLYLSGGDGWSSLTYNASHDATNNTWVFPDSSRTAVTIEMDDSRGATPRFEVWSTTSGAKTSWIQRLAINGDSGNVLMAHNGGSVGISTTTPSRKLHVEGDEIHSGGTRGGFSFGNRQTAGFVDNPPAGERWVWYSSVGNARLWSGGDKLVVDLAGNIKLGPNASLFAAGGVENLRIIRGTVDKNGNTIVEGDFTANKNSTGTYTITFSSPFALAPSGSVTQIFNGGGGGGDTRDNAVIIEITNTAAKLKTGNSLGQVDDRDFTFFFVGPR